MSREYCCGRLVTGYSSDGVLSYNQDICKNFYFKYKKATIIFTGIEGIRHSGNYVGEISFGSADDEPALIKIHASEGLLNFLASFNNLPSYKDDLGLRVALNMSLELSPRGILGIPDFLSEWINKARHPSNGNNCMRASHIIRRIDGLHLGSHKNDSLEQIKDHLRSPEHIVASDVGALENLLAEQLTRIEWANR